MSRSRVPGWKDDALVRPGYFRPFFRKVGRRAFLVFQADYLERLAALGGYETGRTRRLGPTAYLPGTSREDFGIAGPVTGAPAAALAAEFLIMLGCREIVCFGICGSIHGRFRIGGAVIPTGAVPEDGASRLYLPDRELFATDPELSATVRRAAEDAGLEPRPARAWTTDAFFRETPEKVERYRRAGCRVVDMELSALSAVCACRGAHLAALWIISDELFAGRWRPGFLLPRFKGRVQKALAALLSLREG